jgi:hypothetical protein
MSLARQEPLAGMESVQKYEFPESRLLEIALTNNAAIDVIERLAALQDKAKAQRAESDWHEAMNRVQGTIGRVAPDLTNPQTHSKYASYAAIDKVVRPIYTQFGFSLSFDNEDSPKGPEWVRTLCYVSRYGHTRTYKTDMPIDGKGIKGNEMMTKTHATATADSYAMRYLVKKIFNIAIGEDDTDGNFDGSSGIYERLEWIANAKDLAELQKLFTEAYKMYGNSRQSQKLIIEAKDKRKAELQ